MAKGRFLAENGLAGLEQLRGVSRRSFIDTATAASRLIIGHSAQRTERLQSGPLFKTSQSYCGTEDITTAAVVSGMNRAPLHLSPPVLVPLIRSSSFDG